MPQETVLFRKGRRKRQAELKRQRILEEAAAAFVERGVYRTTLDDIADRLGITKPALYYYFSSRDEIIAACLATAMSDNEAALARARCTEGTGLEKLRLWLSEYAAGIQRDFGKCVVLIDPESLGHESRQKHRAAQRRQLDSSRDLIRQGIADGSIQSCDPGVAVLTLFGAINSMTRWYDPDGELALDQVIDQVLAILENGIRAQP